MEDGKKEGAAKKQAHKIGKYSDDLPGQVYDFVIETGSRCTKKAVSRFLGVTEQTLARWFKNHPELKEAYELGIDDLPLPLAVRDNALLKYEPDQHPGRAYRLCSRHGCTMQDLADMLGVSADTISGWKTKHPEFADAMARGLDDYAENNVRKGIVKAAAGYKTEEVEFRPGEEGSWEKIKKVEKEVPPNVAAGKFLLQNLQPDKWQERTVTDHTGQINLTTSIPEPDALPEKIIDTEAVEKEEQGESNDVGEQ